MAASNTPKKSTTKRGTSAKKKSSARTQSKKNTAGKQSISSGFQTEIILLVLMAAAASVYLNAVDRQLFETALLENVDYAVLGMDEDSVRSFADETILFLTDAQDSWEPSITVAVQN